MDERLEAIVSGRVQMVMYRDFACRKARSLGIVGEVQNMKDGTVRVVAEGTRAKLEMYLKHLSRGPLFARVDHVESSWFPTSNSFTTFTLRYD